MGVLCFSAPSWSIRQAILREFLCRRVRYCCYFPRSCQVEEAWWNNAPFLPLTKLKFKPRRLRGRRAASLMNLFSESASLDVVNGTPKWNQLSQRAGPTQTELSQGAEQERMAEWDRFGQHSEKNLANKLDQMPALVFSQRAEWNQFVSCLLLSEFCSFHCFAIILTLQN